MGLDELHPQLLKECAAELAYSFSILFNHSMLAGSLPQSWKVPNPIPIYKKGPKTDPLNYKLISLNLVKLWSGLFQSLFSVSLQKTLYFMTDNLVSDLTDQSLTNFS